MRRSLYVLPVLALATIAACHRGGSGAAASAAPKAPATPPEVNAKNIALGDSIYHNGACQRCHGATAEGAQNGPSLVSGPWLHSTGKYEEIVATITNGVPRTQMKDQTRRFPMNPRGGPMNLNDDQVKALAAYVYSISRSKTPPAV